MRYDSSLPALLEIRNLSIRFGATHAVRGVDLEIGEGEVLGLVGESGSGKSVTSLAVLGLLGAAARAEGSILWHGASHRAREGAPVDLLRTTPQELRRIRGVEIAMIFQEPMTALNPVLSIGRQVAECLKAHAPALTRREARQRAIAALEAVSIPEATRTSSREARDSAS